jgi:flagellar biosynthesis protein FlhB
MAEEDGEERTEQATAKRRREARERGQVARSRELGTMAAMLASSGALLLLGPSAARSLMEVMRKGLARAGGQALDQAGVLLALRDAIVDALMILAPFFAVMLIAALAASVALGGWSFSASALGFQWSKLNPAQGLKRMFSLHGLLELLKALGKFALIAATAIVVLRNKTGVLLDLGREPLPLALGHAASLIGWAFLLITLPLIVLAGIDVPLQLWQYAKQLRMTRQEVRDEMKDTEGKPEVKGRIRRVQQEFARRRMMAEVPRADVIVTNPTHYAVALTYRPEKSKAPVLVAKGLDLLALQIRGVGASHKVPVVEAPALARALYFSTPLNREIPVGLYLAVAQVLAYVYQLRHNGRGGGNGSNSGRPIAMADLSIPEEFRHSP